MAGKKEREVVLREGETVEWDYDKSAVENLKANLEKYLAFTRHKSAGRVIIAETMLKQADFLVNLGSEHEEYFGRFAVLFDFVNAPEVADKITTGTFNSSFLYALLKQAKPELMKDYALEKKALPVRKAELETLRDQVEALQAANSLLSSTGDEYKRQLDDLKVDHAALKDAHREQGVALTVNASLAEKIAAQDVEITDLRTKNSNLSKALQRLCRIFNGLMQLLGLKPIDYQSGNLSKTIGEAADRGRELQTSLQGKQEKDAPKQEPSWFSSIFTG